MKQQLVLSLRQSQQFFENQCKICFHSFDDGHRHPMLICEAHHLLCEQCFGSIKKDRKQVVCPFCKRNTKASRVQRFKYALTANQLYANIKAKYFELLDLYDRALSLGGERDSAEPQQLLEFQRQEAERRLPLAEMNSMIVSLRSQLNQTRQLHNSELQQARKSNMRVDELVKQLQVYKFKLYIFEKKCEMREQQLEQVQRESEERILCLYQEVERLNRLNHTQAESIAQLIQENTALFRDNQGMKEQLRREQRRTPKIEFIRSEIPLFQYEAQLKESAVTDYESDKQNRPFN